MATPIQVIYGTEVDATVDGDLTPEQIINALKETYKELSDSQYSITEGDGLRVMRITLKEGKKAILA
ncbi:hypothetical protein KAZ66_00330 [Candidatus Woesebacteria bacterium]|nr:hypothetical protein [Candidatus Woesebacteria bacterium]